jgi:hypothetical protein
MRSQAERDQQTITIATSLAIFVGILGAGALLGILINGMGDLSDRATSALTLGTLLLAGVAGLAHLVRHRRW